MTPLEKRTELQAQLRAYDQELADRHGPRITSAGKCLLMGRHYAESAYVYFSLNPGFARDGSILDLQSQAESNIPFFNPDALRRQYVYLHNCQRFLTNHPPLAGWMNARVTSAFLVPWRTRNAGDLYTLNRQTRGQLFDYARELVRMIICHHHARLLIIAGKSSITLLNDLGVPDRPIRVDHYHGPGGAYQWSRSEAIINSARLTILQIPHFSRANSPAKLLGLAEWLRQELEFYPATATAASAACTHSARLTF